MAVGLESEWWERNKSRAYPFSDESVSFSSPSYVDVKSLIVDGCLTFGGTAITTTWRLVSFNLSTGEAVVRYASTSVTLTGGSSSTVDAYKIWTWSTAESAAVPVALMLVINTQASNYTATSFVLSTNAYFTARCLNPALVGVRTFKGAASVTTLTEGTNIELRVDPNDERMSTLDSKETARPATHRIFVDAIPGAGTGTSPNTCGEPADRIYTINRISPVNGNFKLDSDGCYRIQRPAGAPGAGQLIAEGSKLQLNNDCTACCNCVDFAEALEKIRAVKDEGLVVKGLLDLATVAYNDVVDAMSDRASCTTYRLELEVYSFPGWLVSFTARVSNLLPCVLPGCNVDVTFSSEAGIEPVQVYGSAMVLDKNDTGYQQLDGTAGWQGAGFAHDFTDGIEPGGSRTMTGAIRYTGGLRVDGTLVTATLTVTPDVGDAIIVGPKSVGLKQNSTKSS